MVFSILMVVPYPGDAIVSTRKHFTPSFKNETKFTKNIVAEEAHKDVLNNVFLTGFENESCIDAVFSERSIQSKVRQAASDELSACKKKALEALLNAPGYRRP